MISRTSNLQQTQTFVDQIYLQRQRLEQARLEVSSGIKVADPSDDPGKAASIAQFIATMSRLEGHKDRIVYAENMLDQQEAALESANGLLVRAKEIANQAANETVSPEVRKQLAGEVFELRDALVSLANTKYQGRYIYGGADDDDAPYDQAAVSYGVPAAGGAEKLRYVYDAELGTLQTRTVQVSDDDSVRINTGGDLWGESISQLERLGRALAGYRTDPENTTGATTGGGAAYVFPTDTHDQTKAILSCLNFLETERQSLVEEKSDVGGRMNRLDQAKQIIETVLTNTEQAKSMLQDSDIFEATAKLTNLETGLQALLATGARINSLSLLDYF